jgi:fructosamine-3-kinase
LEAAVGAKIAGTRPVSGGDINAAEAVTLTDGRRVFVKSNAREPAGMFQSEAAGLAWLAEAQALRVPDVVTFGAGFLALELVDAAPRARDFDEQLGRGLAALHRFGAPGFGLDRDNLIGRLPQDNTPEPDWPTFYRARRLEPQLRLAVDEGLAGARMRSGFERLFARLPERCGPPDPPARLHGDLWAGNLLVDDAGGPCLCDPAVYGGHREVDLAMMRLFGGYGPRVFAAYADAWPLAAGHQERVALYQLYPLMVHVNLFGGGYVGQVEAALERLA